MKRTTLSIALVFAFAMLLSACGPEATPPPAEPQVILTFFSPNGIEYLTLEDLQALPVTEGYAGIKSSTGQITIPAFYQGVALKDLASAYGITLDPTMGITLTAEDGYSMTFSYNQIVDGEFIAYDPALGNELDDPDPLTAILAYSRDGEPLDPEEDGTLRLMVVSETNNQVVDGHWTIKWVSEVEIKSIGQSWTLDLQGAIITPVDRGSYQSCASPGCHGVEWQDENGNTWEGVPLWLLVGQVDDENTHDDFAYNEDLAESGYTVDVIAADGYTVTFDSLSIQRSQDILVAYLLNTNELSEEYYPLRLVGSGLENNQMVGQIVQIIVHVPPAPTPTEAAAPAEVSGDLVITGLVDQPLGLMEADLRAMELMTITAEHPRDGLQEYNGVPLNALLDQAGVQPGATTLVFTATDGYTVEVALSDVRACPNSLVAFGETPGEFNVILPDLPTNTWAKQLARIEVK